MTGNKKSRLFYGYVVMAAAFTIMTLTMGANRSFGVFLDPMLSEFGWTRAGISGAFTMGMLVMGSLGIVAGRLIDRIGPRTVLIGCGMFSGLGYILTSRVDNMWQLYLFYGLIVGAGMSGISPLVSLVARWFVKRRSLMAGILTAGLALGVSVVPLITSSLIAAYGWRVSYIILGAVVMVSVVLAAQLLRRDPGQMGLRPYGADEVKEESLASQTEGLSLAEAVRTGQFWMLSLVSFCHFFLINVVVVHIVIHAIGLGISATVAASVMSIGAAVSIPGRIMAGAVADRIGNKRAMAILYLGGFLSFILLLFARELWLLYLFSIIFGLSGWATGAMKPALTAELFGLRAHGTIIACTGLATTIGGAVGPVLAGYLYDVSGSYQSTFLICIVVSIIAVVATVCLKPTISR
ncbi:MFS transporter [Chloroflexota bacterium]